MSQTLDISNFELFLIKLRNIKGLHHLTAKILGLENQSCDKDSIPLWRRENRKNLQKSAPVS